MASKAENKTIGETLPEQPADVNQALVDDGTKYVAPGSEPDDDMSRFSKEQLMKSNRYGHRRDILAALLDDATLYSHAAVDRLIKEFSERRAM